MTTKYRIIFGFAALTVLLVTLAFFGYKSLSSASGSFSAYSTYARVDLDIGNARSLIYNAAFNMGLYSSTREDTHRQEALRLLDEAIEVVKGVRDGKAGLSLRGEVERVLGALSGIKGDFAETVKGMSRHRSVYYDVVVPVIYAMEADFQKLADIAATGENVRLVNYIVEAGQILRRIAQGYAIFGATSLVTDADAILVSVAQLEELIDGGMARQLTVVETRSYHAVLVSHMVTLQSLVLEMRTDAGKIMATRKAMNSARDEAITLISQLFKEADARAVEVQKTSEQASNTAKMMLVYVSIAGVLVAVFLAVFITWSLLRTLRGMAEYASNIASGNFAAEVNIKEKGEVGKTVSAMREIPEILNNMAHSCRETAIKIRTGAFRQRMDEDIFQGAFREMAHDMNGLAESFSSAFDAMPVNLVATDVKGNIAFMNKSATAFAGVAAQRVFAAKTFPEGVIVDPGFEPVGVKLERALAGNDVQQEETKIFSGSGEIFAAVSMLPLRRSAGTVVGCLEIITDLTEIKGKEMLIRGVAEEASYIADRVADAALRLNEQMAQIAHSSQLQTERMESTASAMTEMNATVMEVSRNAGTTAELCEDTRAVAEAGSLAVQKVVEAINEVEGVASQLQGNMEDLGRQADGIGNVINVISDIADQTNLLALNAAIEAARAGEAGKGFAVVADEVRKLAEKTMGATQEVGKTIVAIQNSAQQNIAQVGVAYESVSVATNLADQSGEVLHAIVQKVEATSSYVVSIATAAEEQSATSEEITQSVNDVNRLVGESTNGVTRSASAIQDLTATAEALRGVLEKLTR